MELKGRRELFCREYLKDLNGAQSAIRAGYSRDNARQQAHELLNEAEVQDRVAELAAARNEKFEIQAVDVLRELHRIASIDPLPVVDDDGVVKSLADIPVDLRRAIQSIEVDTIGSGVVQRTKVKFWNKNDALNSLGRHLALFKDVVINQFEGGVVIADAEVFAKAAAILEDARRRKVDGSDLV